MKRLLSARPTHLPYIIALAVCSLLLVFYKYLEIPRNLAYDEVASTQLASYLSNHPFTVYSPLATGHATPYYYLIALSFRLLGVSTLSLRLPAALFGIMNVFLIYILASRVLGKKYWGFCAALLLITSHWYLNFARFSFEATYLMFLELISLIFMLKESGNDMRNVAVSAVFAALACYSYLPGRIFFLVPLIYLAWTGRSRMVIFFCTVLLLTAPLLLYFINHPDVRVSQISILSDTKTGIQEKTLTIADNGVRAVTMLFTAGDMNGRHNFPGKPALNGIMGFLFLSGIAWSLYKKDRHAPLFGLYALMSVIPTLFTPSSDNPNMLRTVTMIPAVIYFMTVSVKHFCALRIGGTRKPLVLAVTAVLIVSVMYELRTYFLFQSRVFRNAFEVTCPLQELSKWGYAYIPKRCTVQRNEF